MPFTSFTSGTKTYVPREPGRYILSTSSFGDPEESIRITPPVAVKNRSGFYRMAQLLTKENEVTVDGVSKFLPGSLQLSYVYTADFTAADLRAWLDIMHDSFTESVLNRCLQREV